MDNQSEPPEGPGPYVRQVQPQPKPERSIILKILTATPTVFIAVLVFLWLVGIPIYGKEFIFFMGTCIGKGTALAFKVFGIINGVCGLVTYYLYWQRAHHQTLWDKTVQPFVKKHAFVVVMAQLVFILFCIAPFVQYQSKEQELHTTQSQLTMATNQVAYLKSQTPFLDFSNQLAAVQKELYKETEKYVDMEGRYFDTLAASNNSSVTSAEIQSVIDSVKKEEANDTNKESYDEAMQKGIVATRLANLKHITEQKEGIQPVYYLWNYAASLLMRSLTEMAILSNARDFTATNFPDLYSTSKIIAAGAFSGLIASGANSPGSHWECTYDGWGNPQPRLNIQWNGDKSKPAKLQLVYDGGSTFTVYLTIGDVSFPEKSSPVSNKKTCIENVDYFLNILEEHQNQETNSVLVAK